MSFYGPTNMTILPFYYTFPLRPMMLSKKGLNVHYTQKLASKFEHTVLIVHSVKPKVMHVVWSDILAPVLLFVRGLITWIPEMYLACSSTDSNKLLRI